VSALAALAGAGIALGLLLIAVGLVGTTTQSPARSPGPRTGWLTRTSGGRRLVLLVGAPLLMLAVTGWPVAAVFALVAAAGLPRLLGGRRDAEARMARLQALADWTRRLGDVLGSGAGLEQALEASLATTPPPIAGEVARLVARLRARGPADQALRAFGDDLDDATGDLVVAALLLAADRRGRGLARLLGALAATVDAEVAMRRAVEADRATPRTTARWVVYITVAVVGALVLLDRAYVAPFGTPTGQVVLAVIGGLFAGAFVWMHRLTTGAPGGRFLPAAAARTESGSAARSANSRGGW
jgi:Flp pilus assembly protein TadB